MTTQEQKHPQHHRDRAVVDNLLKEQPSDLNLVELARLKIRYRGFPGAFDIQTDLDKIMQDWNYTEETLFEKTRKIHAKGKIYRGEKSEQEDWM